MNNDYTTSHCAAIVPSDTAGQSGTRLYAGGAGLIVLDMEGGETDVQFTSVPAGTVLSLRFVRVKAATTAANLKRFWG
jgi:hypothetical protein